MMSARVGAVAVVDGDKLVGIISERDVVGRVVVEGRDPDKTLVADVMTTQVKTAREGMTVGQALEVIHHGRFRHLRLVDAEGRLVGIVSVRLLLRLLVEELDMFNAVLVNFFSADGAGG